ncbi:MAG: DUF58 domain-containing protein [Anaerolineae bacterium]|nr:DUF58 domain-containing protein [Anaerolineae bacterium]MDW8098701.1 DUF58 domain-containing protein [Anaerolineae bacterium]
MSHLITQPSQSPQLFSESFLRQLDQLVLVSRRMYYGQMPGERRSPRRGQSVEFADYRSYVLGDDLRAVDWNVYARLEKLFVKLFVAEEETTVHLLLDASRSMGFGHPGKWPYAVRLAGALGYIALAGMDRIRAAALGDGGLRPTPAMRGKRQALTWFGWLQAQQPRGQAYLGPMLREYAAYGRPIGPALVLSDLLDPSWEEGLAALCHHQFEVTVLHLLSPQEVTPDLEGDLKLVDSETGQAVEITADYDLLTHYRRRLAAWQEQIRSFCARRGIHYVFIETSLSLETLLFSLLRRLRVVK